MAVATDTRLEELKAKYQSVLDLAGPLGIHLTHLHVQDNKLVIGGEAPSENEKNKFWDQIKRVDPSYSDLSANITVNPSLPKPQQASAQPSSQPAQSAGQQSGGRRKYVVQPGDTLSSIAQKFYGHANEYMKIFDANQDRIQDPNKMRAGEEIFIP